MSSRVPFTQDQPRPEQAGPRQELTMTIREAQATVQQPRTSTQVDPIDQMMARMLLAGPLRYVTAHTPSSSAPQELCDGGPVKPVHIMPADKWVCPPADEPVKE